MVDTNTKTQTDTKAETKADPRDAQIADLQKQLAAAKSTPKATATATTTAAPKKKAKIEKAGARTHVAVARGYSIVNGAGVLVEPGEFVPEGTPLSVLDTDLEPGDDRYGIGWMKKVSKKEAVDAEMALEASQQKPKDVDYTQASKPGLEALALMYGINVGGLDKDGLIDAIKAHVEKDAG